VIALFDVATTKKAKKFIDRADERLRQQLLKLIAILKFEPVPATHYDVEKLRGSESNYRIRFQGIRVLYYVNWKEKRIGLLKIEKRRDRTYK